jgi:hypothetical protein
MAIAQNFPTIKPSLNFDCTNVERLDPRVAFTRASTGTYFDALGVLRTAAANVPRFTHNPSTLAPLGLLIEGQRTNSLLRSAEFDNASWAKTRATVTANAATAPDGTATADAIVEDGTAANTHDVRQGSISNTATTTWSLSFFIKAVNRTWALIELQNATATSNRARAWFDLQNGVVGTGNTAGSGVTYVSHSIQNVGNGWYRCVLVGTADVAVTTLQAWAEGTTGDNVTGYDGVNGQTSVYIWGAQLEAGAFATSYIPTTTTALTRNADVADFDGNNFQAFYKAAAGTFYIEAISTLTNVGSALMSINDTTAAERISLIVTTSNVSAARNTGNAGVLFTPALSAVSGTELYKVALAASDLDYSLCVNGGTVATAATYNMPSVNRLQIGDQLGSAPLNGTIGRIAYYPARLTNAQLQAITG